MFVRLQTLLILLMLSGLLLSMPVQSSDIDDDIGLTDARKYVHAACPESWESMYSRIVYETQTQIDASTGQPKTLYPDIWQGKATDKATYITFAFNVLLPASQQAQAGLTVELASHDAAVITACAQQKQNLFTVLLRNGIDNTGGFNVGVVRDDDNDGVFNIIDTCPAETTTCVGIKDQCPGTPEGEVVDTSGEFEGCSASQKDTDADGVSDADDLCPQTPAGELADTQGEWIGCSISQKDTDGDGLNDDVDQCPDSDSDFEVNVDGCAINQIDTDGDGINDYDDEYPHQDAYMCYP